MLLITINSRLTFNLKKKTLSYSLISVSQNSSSSSTINKKVFNFMELIYRVKHLILHLCTNPKFGFCSIYTTIDTNFYQTFMKHKNNSLCHLKLLKIVSLIQIYDPLYCPTRPKHKTTTQQPIYFHRNRWQYIACYIGGWQREKKTVFYGNNGINE